MRCLPAAAEFIYFLALRFAATAPQTLQGHRARTQRERVSAAGEGPKVCGAGTLKSKRELRDAPAAHVPTQANLIITLIKIN